MVELLPRCNELIDIRVHVCLAVYFEINGRLRVREWYAKATVKPLCLRKSDHVRFPEESILISTTLKNRLKSQTIYLKALDCVGIQQTYSLWDLVKAE